MLKELFRKKQIGTNQPGDDIDYGNSLHKVLSVRDITALGIAAIIGAGIFSTIGTASSSGGPGVILLFIFTALTCSLAAFCYAEFASRIPLSGSAYTYAYVSFGELFAWIIGWALIMEYAIGNITVAISWSDYFTGLLDGLGFHLPQWMQMDYLTAHKGNAQALSLMHGGKTFESLPAAIQNAYTAYQQAPNLLGLKLVADLPALLITIIITALVYRGIKESRNASNVMVLIKIAVVILVIIVGSFYVHASNWSPFLPNGMSGVLSGVSAVFFAYIGFDAISTTAEECKDPQRDLPRAMMYAIIICTILYVSIALVLTGMVSYKDLAVGDPLAFVFSKINMDWMSWIIGISAIVAMASVMLVFQLGQPRIWMSMSRDGLLPPAFSSIHSKYRTPAFSTIVTGLLVAIPALFLNLTTVTDLCSIGTLFAFVLVCGGVLVLENIPGLPAGKFKTPYVNAKWIMPLLFILTVISSLAFFKEDTFSFLTNAPQSTVASELVQKLDNNQINQVKEYIRSTDAQGLESMNNDVDAYINSLDALKYSSLLNQLPLTDDVKHNSGWNLFKHKIPMWIFIVVSLIMMFLSFTKNLSLIPVLGVLSCLYMMAQIPLKNWIGFTVWLVIGFVFYFSYGIKHSKVR